MVFKTIESFKLIPWVMNIVGNQLISVYCTTFMAISTQEPNITRFSNTPVSKAEYGTACGALPSSAITSWQRFTRLAYDAFFYTPHDFLGFDTVRAIPASAGIQESSARPAP